jgi:membrane protein required for beta-lactamase induction
VPVTEREAPERRTSFWPVVIIAALALFGAVSLVHWVLGFVFGLVKLAIVILIVVAAVLLFRGPPD